MDLSNILEIFITIVGIFIIIYVGYIIIEDGKNMMEYDNPILVNYCINKTGLQYIKNLNLTSSLYKQNFYNCSICNNETCINFEMIT